MNIFEKMSAITNEITAVAKNLNVGWGKSSYKAAGEADILAAVKPIEEKFKIYSYPYDREILESAVLTTSKSDGTESKQQFMRGRTIYRFVDMEAPTDFIDIVSYGDGVDPQDKAPGKAMTYADKYALMKAYKIITGDDPDQYYSADLKGKESKSSGGSGTRYSGQGNSNTSRSRQQAQTPPPQQAQQQEVLFVNANHIQAIRNEMDRTGITEATVLAMAKVGRFEEITMPVFNAIMKKFEKTKSRDPAPDDFMDIPDGADGELPFR